MLTLSAQVRIFVSAAPVDLRRSIDRLAAVVKDAMGEDPISGHLFVFRNRRGDRMKVLAWDRNGYVVWYKRLERGRFSFPPSGGRRIVSAQTFELLIGGLDLRRRWEAPDPHQ